MGLIESGKVIFEGSFEGSFEGQLPDRLHNFALFAYLEALNCTSNALESG